MRKNRKDTHETLYSLGKVQEYTLKQLSRTGNKLKEAFSELSNLISMYRITIIICFRWSIPSELSNLTKKPGLCFTGLTNVLKAIFACVTYLTCY